MDLETKPGDVVRDSHGDLKWILRGSGKHAWRDFLSEGGTGVTSATTGNVVAHTDSLAEFQAMMKEDQDGQPLSD